MGINKNFVVKNGFEVSTNLVLADATTRKVGIGSTVPKRTLDVLGGIGATDIYSTGITTVLNEFRVGAGGTLFSAVGSGNSIGIGTGIPAYLLDIRSSSGTALYVQGNAQVTGDLTVDDITSDQVTLTNLNASGVTTVSKLEVSGLATFSSGLQVVSGIATFGITTSTQVTNQNLLVSGITTLGVTTTTSLTAQQINVSGVVTATSFVGNLTGTATTATTVDITNTNGLTTIYYPTFVENRTNGQILRGDVDLTYRTDDNILTVPNVSATSAIIGAGVTINSTGINVTGFVTATSFVGDGSGLTGIIASGGIGTQWITNSVGIHTFSNVGFGTTNPTHPITAKGTASLENLTVSGISSVGSSITMYSSSGIISATAFYGDGINLTNTGSTLSASSGTQRVVLTSLTSGTMTSSSTDGDLTFDASTNTLAVPTTVVGSAVTINSSGVNVTGITTLGNIQISSGIVTTTASSFELYKPVLFNYSEKVNVIGNTGAGCTINLANGAYVTATLNQSTTFTFTTGITTGAIGFALQLTNGTGGPYSITWPASVYWPNNATPTRTTTDSKTDVWVFTTIDNGTKWYGNLALYNFS